MQFGENKKEAFEDMDPGEKLFVMGDFNGRIEYRVGLTSRYGDPGQNGYDERIHEMGISSGMNVVNTYFQHIHMVYAQTRQSTQEHK